ncbi:MAG: PQQ-binding-like beta-propeller repeat protein [Methanoregula sp.]
MLEILKIDAGNTGCSVLLLPSLILLTLVLTAPVSAQETMFRYDAGHTGDYSQVAGVTETNVSLLWSISMESYRGGIWTTPAIFNGTLYISNIDGTLCALDATTGQYRWNSSVQVYYDTSPAAANDILYVGSADGNVYSLDAATGKTIWSYRTSGPIYSSPTLANGTIYIVSNDGRYLVPDATLFALNATTGKKIWNFTIGGHSDTSPAVAHDIVYIGSEDGTIYALDADTGIKIWSASAGETVSTSPLVKNGIVYIESNVGNNVDTALASNVYAFNTTTGNQIWNFTTRGRLGSDPALARGILYLSGNSLYALNATTGAQIWNASAASASPIVANGVLYYADFNVYAIDAETGTKICLWSFPMDLGGGGFGGSVVVENSVLYGNVVYEQVAPGGHVYDKIKIFALDLNAGTNRTSFPSLIPATTGNPPDSHANYSTLTTILIVTLGIILLVIVSSLLIHIGKNQN